MKKNIALLVFLVFLCEFSQAQTISKSVISSSGGFSSGGDFQLADTFGETVIGNSNSEGLQLSNGYIPSLSIELLSREEFNSSAAVKIYPNPSSHLLYLEQMDQNAMDVSIIDINGKLIFHKNVNSGEALNVSTFATGVYYTNVRDIITGKINIFKIIKH